MERILKTNSTTTTGRPQNNVNITEADDFKIWFNKRVTDFRNTGGRMFRTPTAGMFTLIRADGLITFKSFRSIKNDYEQYKSRFFVVCNLEFEENAGISVEGSDESPSFCVVV